MGRTFSKHGARRSVYKIVVCKPQGIRIFERSGHILENNIKIDLKYIVFEYVD
jgi:hypothetical protein